MTKGTIIEVNCSELGMVSSAGKIIWGKYAQITNNPVGRISPSLAHNSLTPLRRNWMDVSTPSSSSNESCVSCASYLQDKAGRRRSSREDGSRLYCNTRLIFSCTPPFAVYLPRSMLLLPPTLVRLSPFGSAELVRRWRLFQMFIST